MHTEGGWGVGGGGGQTKWPVQSQMKFLTEMFFSLPISINRVHDVSFPGFPFKNNNVKEVGTPPVQSSLCTRPGAASTAVQDKVTKTVSRNATAEEQLRCKTVHPALRAQLHLPPLGLSLALYALFVDNSAARQSIQLWEPSSTSLLIAPGLCHFFSSASCKFFGILVLISLFNSQTTSWWDCGSCSPLSCLFSTASS